MTIVECFEKGHIENMISTLTARPDKLIFIGKESQMGETLEVYKNFLEKQGYETLVDTRDIDKNNLADIVRVLTELVESKEELIIDVTGGEDIVLLAVGMVYQKYRDTYPIKLQKFNLKNGKIIDCDGDDEVSFDGAFSLSVKELISLYGGVVVPETPQPAEYVSSFDINNLWKIVCDDPKRWNKSVSYLREFEAHAEKKEREERQRNMTPEEREEDNKNRENAPSFKMEYSLNIDELSRTVNDYDEKFKEYCYIIRRLLLEDMVEDFSFDGKVFSYKYKDQLIRRCLNKSGDVLEMKTYFEARDLIENKKNFYNDCYMSVHIDWDGVVHKVDDEIKDTRNEIDVILMRGVVPVFISCKNGKVEEDELYKLNTVAERFGGENARKVLIATDFKRDNEGSEIAFKQRCKDMNIIFIEDAQELTDEEWRKTMLNIIKNPLACIRKEDRAILT